MQTWLLSLSATRRRSVANGYEKVQMCENVTYAGRSLANYPNHTDIATSTAVTEIRLAYFLVVLAVSSLSVTNLSGLILLVTVFFLDTEFSASIEATAAIYGSTGWVLTIEILLFTGFLATAITDLVSAMLSGSL